ncbi:MAG: CRISPR-associated protein Cas4 [Chloroherpetonaceae bacterium]|nr:CRISPR-associated protein Cas4 [Chloroherpetonaceae bacterium]MDW8464760.1 CRISPR-associated protein Cas4 [Chloroherpetonaceae bacterium]
MAHLTGTKINYYFVCKRKLWLFSNQIEMEQESDLVAQGKLISETTYPDKCHELDIDGVMVLDFADLQSGVIHEIKKSDKMEEAHLWQVKFYLWHLKSKGLNGLRGELDYPKLKRRVSVTLTENDCQALERIAADIAALERQATPPPKIEKKFCKHCAYFELCWA